MIFQLTEITLEYLYAVFCASGNFPFWGIFELDFFPRGIFPYAEYFWLKYFSTNPILGFNFGFTRVMCAKSLKHFFYQNWLIFDASFSELLTTALVKLFWSRDTLPSCVSCFYLNWSSSVGLVMWNLRQNHLISFKIRCSYNVAFFFCWRFGLSSFLVLPSPDTWNISLFSFV